MTSKQYLEQVKNLEDCIKMKQDEYDRILSLATDTTGKPPDGMPRGGSLTPSRKVESGGVNLAYLQSEIDKDEARLIELRREVIGSLAKLPSFEQSVLFKSYILHMTDTAIAKEMYYSRTHIWRIKKSGLRLLEDVIRCNTM